MRILDHASAGFQTGYRATAVLATLLIVAGAARAQEDPTVREEEGPKEERIHSGAVELGLAGALMSIEGNTQRSIFLRAGSFVALPKGLFGFEGEVGHHHVHELDRLDLLGTVAWVLAFPNSSVHPYAFASGGLRQEWIGSFRQSRIPIGGGLGFRALTGSRAGVRLDYRALRITDDPVEDYTEHQVSLGLSIFFRNPAG
jgi:hypothetical protein